MVLTRSGKSTINSSKLLSIEKSQKRAGKAKEKISIFVDQEFSVAKNKMSEEMFKQGLKINRNTNRLSHNHIRFTTDVSPIAKKTQLSPVSEASSSQKGKHKRELEDEVAELLSDLPPPEQILPTLFSPSIHNSVFSPTGSNKKIRRSIPSEENNLTTTQTQLVDVKTDLFLPVHPEPLSVDVQSSVVNTVVSGAIKKLVIHDDEKGMNGAPEGELFDVVLLSDDQLPPLVSGSEVVSVLEEQLLASQQLDKNAWARQYEIITFVRQFLYHHLQTIVTVVDKSSFVLSFLQVLSEGLQSLRSSNVRNALYGVQFFFQKKTLESMVKLSNDDDTHWLWKAPVLQQLLSTVILKTGQNPKFIATESFQTLQSMITVCPWSSLLVAPAGENALPFIHEQYLLHRNMDISFSLCQLLAEKVSVSIRGISEWQAMKQLNPDLLKLLYQTWSQAKKAQSKEKMKKVFQHLQQLYSSASSEVTGVTFVDCLREGGLSDSQVDELQRELSKTQDVSLDKENQPMPKKVMGSVLTKVGLSKPVTASASSVAKPWKLAAAATTTTAQSTDSGPVKSKFAMMREQMKGLKPRDCNQLANADSSNTCNNSGSNELVMFF